jgi:sulfotransferase
VQKYYFLSGLPRAGNTLLGSILNQNPLIGVTANSLLPEIFYTLETLRENNPAYQNCPDFESYNGISKALFNNYYSHWKQEYIIDRSAWGTPYNLNLLRQYCPNEIKIICLVRDVKEVFQSFLRWCELNPNNFLNAATNNGSIEEKFQFLINPNSQLIKCLASIKNLKTIDPSNKMHMVVDYNDLVKFPALQIQKIYEFLEIPNYQHCFTRLDQFSHNGIPYNDSVLGDNLHFVTKSIKKQKYKIQVPKKILAACQDLNVWL